MKENYNDTSESKPEGEASAFFVGESSFSYNEHVYENRLMKNIEQREYRDEVKDMFSNEIQEYMEEWN